MNHLSNSRFPREGKSFEIQQTADEVRIVTRDRLTNEICQIVTIRGEAEVDQPRKRRRKMAFAHERGMEPVSSGRRW